MTEVLSIVAAACFVDAFIAFTVLSILVSNPQGRFVPRLHRPLHSSDPDLFEETVRFAKDSLALEYQAPARTRVPAGNNIY